MRNETPTVLEFQSDNHTFRLECLKSISAMEELRLDWKKLESKSQDPFVYFQSFDWCLQWAKHYAAGDNLAAGSKLQVYSLYCDKKLVMIWPMMIDEIKFGIKALTFLTEPLGQYGNILCDEDLVNSEIVKRVWDVLRASRNVDAVTVNHFPVNGLLAKAIGQKGHFNKIPINADILDLEAMPEWETYLASLKKKVRKRRNHRRNKIAKLGEINFEVHYGGSQRYRELIDEALDMKMRWLKETGRISLGLSTQTARNFLRDLDGTQSNENGRPDGAVVQVLTVDGKSVGIEVGLCLNDRYCAYLGAFDLELHDYSPGKIQMEMTQKWAKETGFVHIDFLGDPAEYKATWTDKQVGLASNSVPISARGYFYCVLWKFYIRRWLKEIHGAMGADWRKKLLGALRAGRISSEQPQNASEKKPTVVEISTKGI